MEHNETIVVEIRSAEGGSDSKLLVLDQFALYEKAARLNGLWLELVEEREGFISFLASGQGAQRLFENEPGGHRFQRIPPTERKGRVHTSTITVAVLSVPKEALAIPRSEVEFRDVNLGGKGGQNRNRHYTDVIATHRSTGIQVTCRGRSNCQNKELALQMISAKVAEHKALALEQDRGTLRKSQVGSGMRGDKVRTIRHQDGVVKCEITGRQKPLKKYLSGDIVF